jgi:ornithine carbamoyltransferase
LADLLTVLEEFGKTEGLKLAYIGDAANNMGNSYLVASALAGMSVAVAAPKGYQPDEKVVAEARAIAERFGQTVEVFEDPRDAVVGAHVVATDTWVSMGMEDEKEARVKVFADYTVTEELMSLTDKNGIFLHCLPAYRGYEVAAEVIDGPRSRIWDEAENRLHAQKALMLWLSQQN